jgi:hypothetical protein
MEKGEESWRGRRDGHSKNLDENVVDENVANQEQLSPVSSLFSISTDTPSLVFGATLSSTSSIDQLTSTAEKFVTWLLKDEVIHPLQVIAI